MLTFVAGPPLLSPDAMRAAEATAIAGGTPARLLMERAATAAAQTIRAFCPAGEALVLCGPGNNGGDGYGVALALAAAGVRVTVAADSLPLGDPAAALAALWTGPVIPLSAVKGSPLVIDALFGTGLSRPLPAAAQAALDACRGTGTVVALDIASGIDAATGAALGTPLPADLTVAFGAQKPGHVLAQGRRASGRVVTADIGVPVTCNLHLVAPPRRTGLAADVHKYRRGAVLVVEGDPAHGGAARLTALAALRAGAGLVTLAGPGQGAPADAIMRRSDTEARAMLADPRLTAIAIGPGLADAPRGQDWLMTLLAGATPLVVDAGALGINLGARGIAAQFASASAPLVLTPHQGEFTRIFGAPGADRIAAVRAAAAAANAVVMLKGAETIIAAPDGRAAINFHAALWLATAGSGDVLTGIVAALLAQGHPPFEAACMAAWLHGDAGHRGGPGLIADDIPALLPQVLAAL
jgi:hydroxyethylthiazole kinase-like uncharacterized protein yjeF